MHPELSKRLTLEQLDEAMRRDGLFGSAVQLEEWSYPTFFIRFVTVSGPARLLRFDARNYDLQPLDIAPVDPANRRPLELGAWMKRDGRPFPAHPLQGDAPFLCLKGTRSYYTHPHHSPNATGERWEQHRSDLRIVDLLIFMRDRFAAGGWA